MDLSALRYAPSHEWAKLDGDVVTVGISQFASDQLGDVTFLELPKVGRSVTAGEEIGIVESVKSTSPIYSPVRGSVIAVNDAVVNDTELIKNDPFGAGWFMKVKLAAGADLNHLLDKARYDAQIAAEGH